MKFRMARGEIETLLGPSLKIPPDVNQHFQFLVFAGQDGVHQFFPIMLDIREDSVQDHLRARAFQQPIRSLLAGKWMKN